MDIDAISLGEDFVEAIETTVAKCDVLIAVIGKNRLLSKDSRGNRHLDNPEDFVRMEIGAALKILVRKRTPDPTFRECPDCRKGMGNIKYRFARDMSSYPVDVFGDKVLLNSKIFDDRREPTTLFSLLLDIESRLCKQGRKTLAGAEKYKVVNSLNPKGSAVRILCRYVE